jgi:protein-tyrosine phosphatase
MFNQILVICYGNVCRSPAAEAILANRLKQLEPKITIQSAGIGAHPGQKAHRYMVELLSEKGIDLTAHRAQRLNQDLVTWADLILVMENLQMQHLEQAFPGSLGKTQLLGRWDTLEIPDPIQKDRNFFITLP